MLPLRGLVTRRADIIGIQSVYFRIRVKDVLTRFVQLPWVGKWLSNNVGRPIRCICSINSGMSSTRSVMMLGISFMPRA